jgi:hypothetical protein
MSIPRQVRTQFSCYQGEITLGVRSSSETCVFSLRVCSETCVIASRGLLYPRRNGLANYLSANKSDFHIQTWLTSYNQETFTDTGCSCTHLPMKKLASFQQCVVFTRFWSRCNIVFRTLMRRYLIFPDVQL